MTLIDDVLAILDVSATNGQLAKLAELFAKQAEAVECWELVERLTADEGDSVEVLHEPYDFGVSPAVECNGTWTDWEDRRFTGGTRLTALRAAVAAMDKAKEG